MDYRSLIDTVCRRLKGLGIGCEVEAGKVATERAIAKIEDKIKVRLPPELRAFYLTVGDGYSLAWQADAEDLNLPFANLQIPTLKLACTPAGAE